MHEAVSQATSPCGWPAGGATEGVSGIVAAAGRFARLLCIALGVALLAGGGWLGLCAVADSWSVVPLTPPAIELDRLFIEQTPTRITVSVGWQHLPLTVPAWRLRSDRTLWLQMGFEDWDTVPPRLRRAGLAATFRSYAERLAGPTVWRSMTAADWDLVPPPVRTVAILRMIDTWVERTASPEFGPAVRARLSNTIAAVVMVESWFNHRAVNVNPAGDRDLGLAQASVWCRKRLDGLDRQGVIGVRLTDADYFNPWTATYVATVWFLRMLDEADGDLDLAIRAYHRGIANARLGAGRAYLRQVLAKRWRFIENADAPPTWRWVFNHGGLHVARPGDLVQSKAASDEQKSERAIGQPLGKWGTD
jgi:hypothetical protein